jgi:hypothetical protein
MFYTTLLLVVTAALGVATLGEAAERAPASGEIPPGCVIVEGDILVRERDLNDFIQGTYEVNLWTNGVVPYVFTTNDGNTVDMFTATDISFVAGNPPQILCVSCNFFTREFTEGEEILVSGSTSNDNTAGNGYTATLVAATAITLTVGDAITNEAAGNSITLRTTRSVTPPNQQLMLNAMAAWEAVATLNFVPRTNQSNYLNIRNSTVNSSFVGMQSGVQYVNIQDWSANRFTKHHELGHALGYRHEHTRPDRDSFVQINWGNIESGEAHNFTISSTADAYPIGAGVGVYDFDSVMHYGQCAFSNCASCFGNPVACRTITVLPPYNVQWQNNIGQNNHLSNWDMKVMSFLYPESNWVFLHASSTTGSPNGEFVTPYTSWGTAYTAVPSQGKLIILYPDTYSAAGTYSKAMTIEAPLGGVVLD